MAAPEWAAADDPRAKLIKKVAYDVFEQTGLNPKLEIALELERIALQILLPFLLGQLARPLVGGWITRHKAVTGLFDRGSILLVVYTAFSAAVVAGLWSRVSVPDLGWISAGLLAGEGLGGEAAGQVDVLPDPPAPGDAGRGTGTGLGIHGRRPQREEERVELQVEAQAQQVCSRWP